MTYKAQNDIIKTVKKHSTQQEREGDEMKKEVYRSFEGKLSPECQRGYIVYDCGEYWEINHQTVWMDEKCFSVRIKKGYKLKFDDIERIEELEFGVNNGIVDGQAAYNGKWYSTETINKIQEKNNCRQTFEPWQRFVK